MLDLRITAWGETEEARTVSVEISLKVDVPIIVGEGKAEPHKVGEFRITGRTDLPFVVCAKTAWGGIVKVADPWPTKIWQAFREWLEEHPEDKRRVEKILYGRTEGRG